MIAVKDPRICKVLSFYERAISDAGYDVKILLAFRNPVEVIKSLQKRDQLSGSHAALLWLRYTVDAEYQSRGSNRVFVNYSDVLKDWKAVEKRISEGLSVDFPVKMEDAQPLIDDFINPDLNNYRRSTEDVILTPLTRGWVASVYEALITLASNPNSAHALKKMNDARTEFGHAEPIIMQLFFDQQSYFDGRVEDFRKDLTAAQANEQVFEAEASEAKQWALALEQEATKEKDRIEAMSSAFSALETRYGKLGENLSEVVFKYCELCGKIWLLIIYSPRLPRS